MNQTIAMKKILLIEDDAMFGKSLCLALETNGYKVSYAKNGQTGLEMARSFEPDLILLDIMLPDINGIEVCRSLKSDAEYQSIPIILLTALNETENIVKGFSAGANDYIAKPYDLYELFSRVKSRLKMKELYDTTKREEEEKSALLDVSRTLASVVDPFETLYTIVSQIAGVIDVKRCSIISIDPSNKKATVVASHDAEDIRNLRIDLNKYPEIQEVVKTRKPMIINDVHSEPVLFPVRDIFNIVDIKSIMAFPIIFKDALIGILTLRTYRRETPFNEREIRFCNVILHFAAAPLKSALLIKELKKGRARDQKALLESEKTYEAFVQALPDIIYQIDKDGNFVFLNNAVKVLGYEPEELLGTHFSKIIHPEEIENISASYVLPKYKGKKSDNEKSPKIFDERRTGGRITKDLEVRLIPRGREKTILGAMTTFTEVTAIGKYDPDGPSGKKKLVGTVGIIRDITQRRKAEEALRSIATGFTSITGGEFFDNVARHLSETLDMNCIFIAKTFEKCREKIRMVAIYFKGQIQEPFVYDLANTPCGHVIGQNLCCYPSGVQKRFPEDKLLVKMDAECYIGIPLFDRSGNPLGIMGATDGKPLKDKVIVESMFRVFAGRVSSELERLGAEESLREREKMLAKAQQIAHLGNWDWDITANTLFWSDEIYRIFGVSLQKFDATYEAFLNSIHPDDLGYLQKSIHETFYENKPFSLDHRIILPNGEERTVHEEAEVIFDESGKPLRMIGTVQDITEKKLAEEIQKKGTEQLISYQKSLLELAKLDYSDLGSALKKITEVVSNTLNVTQVGIWVFNKDRSEIVCENFYNMSENVHKSGMRLKYHDYPNYFTTLEESRIIAATDALSDSRTIEFSEKYLIPNKITSMMDVPVRLHGKVVGIVCHEHSGPPREWPTEDQNFANSIADMVSLAFESSERKQAEEALNKNKELLAHANRMTSLGVLAAGIAHEINNPVNYIMLNSSLIDEMWEDIVPLIAHEKKIGGEGKRTAASLDKAVKNFPKLIKGLLEGSERIKNIVSGLRDFSRVDSSRYNEEIQIKELVCSSEELLTRLLHNKTNHFKVRIDNLPAIRGNFQKLEQVFVNLLTNACQSLTNTKQAIEITGTHDESRRIVILKVRDEGVGMDDKTLRNVMEPFFTTKQESGGTGLGVSISYGIIKDHGGLMEYKSEPGKGTTVTITLPVAGGNSHF